MINATATPFKTIFNQKPQQPIAPLPVRAAPVSPKVAKPKEVKTPRKYWGYLSARGRVVVMRYVEKCDDDATLSKADDLEYKDFTRMSTKAFQNWYDDGTNEIEPYEAKTRADAMIIAEKLLSKAKADFAAAKKTKKTDAK